MCRLLGYCARRGVSVAGLLGQPGLREFTALSALHRDGWGMAWYGPGGPHVHRSALRASGEPAYQRLALRSLGDLGLVHLRWATPGLPVSERNTHPFTCGDTAFAHNGAIHPQDRLGELLPPAWERRLGGTTDSERYFLHIMARLADRQGDMIAAVSDTADRIDRLLRPNSLNAVLLTPTALYAICWHYPDRIPAAQLRSRGHVRTDAEAATYFDLAYRASRDAVVVASSGWPQPGWTALPNRHVLVVERGTLRTAIRPLGAGTGDTTPWPGRRPFPATAASRSAGR